MRTCHTCSRLLVLLVVALVAISMAGCQLVGDLAGAPPAPSPTAAAAIAGSTVAPGPISSAVAAGRDFSTAIRQVATQAKPTVVQITSQQVQVDLFNRPFEVPGGVGSGVIYDRDGHILTNNHVIEGAQKLLVSLPDGRSFDGELVGADPHTDLAVLQIKGADLPIAELGDSGRLQVGDWVVAIGNALGLEGGPTVSTGVVRALGRTVQEPGGPGGGGGPFLFDVIQTDAPINPGNSGGPLMNLDGQVVGINTLVAGQAEPGVQAQGIGFAIALATAKPIADQLVSTGRAIHPYLGVGYVALTPAIAAQLRIVEKTGALVRQVVADSPADQAGLQRGDVIAEMDGTPVKGDSALAQAINAHKPGDTVTLTVWRDGQKLTVQATLGEMPASSPEPAPAPARGGAGR